AMLAGRAGGLAGGEPGRPSSLAGGGERPGPRPRARPASGLRPRLERLGDQRRARSGPALRSRLAGGRRQRRRRGSVGAQERPMSAEVTIVGYPFQPTGMAEHARSAFRAFQAVGVTPRLLDVADANRGFDPDLERDFGPHLVTTLGEGVNLFGVNGDEAARVIDQVGERAFESAYNIAYPAWELARYPRQ